MPRRTRRKPFTTEDTEGHRAFQFKDFLTGRILLFRGEPIKHPIFEFFRLCAECSAVICVGDFPQNCLRIVTMDDAGMSHGDVAVDFAMD